MPLSALSADLFWLAMAGLCMSLLWLPHIGRGLMQQSWKAGLWNPQHEIEPQPQWAKRAKRSQRNAARHFAIFGILVLVAHISGGDADLLSNIVKLWLFTRLAHFVTYSAGVPTIPQLLFLANIGISLALAVGLMQAG